MMAYDTCPQCGEADNGCITVEDNGRISCDLDCGYEADAFALVREARAESAAKDERIAALEKETKRQRVHIEDLRERYIASERTRYGSSASAVAAMSPDELPGPPTWRHIDESELAGLVKEKEAAQMEAMEWRVRAATKDERIAALEAMVAEAVPCVEHFAKFPLDNSPDKWEDWLARARDDKGVAEFGGRWVSVEKWRRAVDAMSAAREVANDTEAERDRLREALQILVAWAEEGMERNLRQADDWSRSGNASTARSR